MIKFKFCPRCRGDLYLTEDIFGKYLSCLQCGYLKDLVMTEDRSTLLPVADKEEARDAA